MTIDRPGSDPGETQDTDDFDATGDPASLLEMQGILGRRPERRILSPLLHENGAVPVESLARAVTATDSPTVPVGRERSDGEIAGS